MYHHSSSFLGYQDNRILDSSTSFLQQRLLPSLVPSLVPSLAQLDQYASRGYPIQLKALQPSIFELLARRQIEELRQQRQPTISISFLPQPRYASLLLDNVESSLPCRPAMQSLLSQEMTDTASTVASQRHILSMIGTSTVESAQRNFQIKDELCPSSVAPKKKDLDLGVQKHAAATSDDFLSPSYDNETTIDTSSPINTILFASSGQRQYIDRLQDHDILCGRGGKSNHHPGNQRYRRFILDMKKKYKNVGRKGAKTDLSIAIVNRIYAYGGRFLRYDDNKEKYYNLTQSEARKKTSQALREARNPLWT